MVSLTKMNKKGGFVDLFVFMIISFILLMFSGVFIYIGTQTETVLHEKLVEDPVFDFANVNESDVLDNTIDKFNSSLTLLYWLVVMIMGGMIMSIFIGSFLVQTKPIFFVAYIFIVMIATVVSVALSNGYERIISTPEMVSSFEGFTAANYIMINLPVWIVVIGMVGGIIMFSQIGSKDSYAYSGY